MVNWQTVIMSSILSSEHLVPAHPLPYVQLWIKIGKYLQVLVQFRMVGLKTPHLPMIFQQRAAQRAGQKLTRSGIRKQTIALLSACMQGGDLQRLIAVSV